MHWQQLLSSPPETLVETKQRGQYLVVLTPSLLESAWSSNLKGMGSIKDNLSEVESVSVQFQYVQKKHQIPANYGNKAIRAASQGEMSVCSKH
jgi:hypothetical protein